MDREPGGEQILMLGFPQDSKMLSTGFQAQSWDILQDFRDAGIVHRVSGMLSYLQDCRNAGFVQDCRVTGVFAGFQDCWGTYRIAGMLGCLQDFRDAELFTGLLGCWDILQDFRDTGVFYRNILIRELLLLPVSPPIPCCHSGLGILWNWSFQGQICSSTSCTAESQEH